MKYKEEDGEFEIREPGKRSPDNPNMLQENLAFMLLGSIISGFVVWLIMSSVYVSKDEVTNIVGSLAHRCAELSNQQTATALNQFAAEVRQRCQCQ